MNRRKNNHLAALVTAMAMSIAFTIHSKAQETIHAGKIVCLDEAVDLPIY